MQKSVAENIGDLELRREGKQAMVLRDGAILFIGSPLAAWAFALGVAAGERAADPANLTLKTIHMTRGSVPYSDPDEEVPSNE